MITDPSLLDLYSLSTEQRAHLLRFLPVELERPMSSPVGLELAVLTRIHRHLGQLLAALQATVPRWLWTSDHLHQTMPAYGCDATVLFADVTGFTALTRQLSGSPHGNETLTRIINRFFSAMVAVVSSFDGDVLAFGGDGLLVAFTGEQHAATAATAAWEMQRAMAVFVDQTIEGLPGLWTLQMKIGLASGPLVQVAVGRSNRRVTLPLGSVLHTTDVMANATEPGQIRLDAHAAAAVTSFAQLAPQSDGSALLLGLHAPQLPVAPQPPFDPAVFTISELFQQVVTLAPYVPASVLENLAAAPRAEPGIGEQRYVYSMFAHIQGLHEVADALGMEGTQRTAAVANDVIERALGCIEGDGTQLGGVLARIDCYGAGHKLLALVGAPLAREQAGFHTIAAAFAVRETITALDSSDNHLNVRIGIDAGRVGATLVGSPVRYEYTVMGDSVNMAARMMANGNSEQGDILIGAKVYDQTALYLHAEPRTVLVKGKSEPVPVWAVRTLHDVARRRITDSPLVGRGSHLETMRAVVEALRRGEHRVMFLEGEAGIGKTRMARQLAELLQPDLPCWFVPAPGGVTTSYASLRTLLRVLCDLSFDAPYAFSEARLREIVTRYCPSDAASLLPRLGFLMGTFDDDDMSEAGGAENQQLALAQSMVMLLEAMASQRGPLAIVFEDLHDADHGSIAILEQMLTLGWTSPILVCMTLRPRHDRGTGMAHPSLGLADSARHTFGPARKVFKLQGLDPQDSATLLKTLIPGIGPTTQQALLERANGNPLFLELLAEVVSQSKALQPTLAGLELRRSIASLQTPMTLSELVATQIDQLPAEVRRLACIASAIAIADRTFPLWLLEQVADNKESVEAQQEALINARIIVQDLTSSEHELYTFRHILFQQVAYDLLQSSDQQTLHQRIGLALHRSWTIEREDRSEILAYHCYAGQLWDLAAQYSLIAGQRAQQTYALSAAYRYLRRAVQLGQRLNLPHQEATARINLAAVMALRARFNLARAYLTSARLICERIEMTSAHTELLVRCYRLLALVDDRTGAYDQAAGLCAAGLELAAQLTGPNLETARLYGQLADVLMHQGNLAKAAEACRSGLAALPDPPTAAHERVVLWQRLAVLDGERGRYPQAIEALQTSLTLARDIGDLALVSQILHNLGVYHNNMGALDQALGYYQESLAHKERINDTNGYVLTANAIAAIFMVRGEYDQALAGFNKVYSMSERLGLALSCGLAAGNIGSIHLAQGRLDQAHTRFVEAQEIYTRINDRYGLTDCAYMLGDIALAQGRPAEALSYGRTAVALARQEQLDNLETCALRVVGEALLAQGDIGAAAHSLEQSWTIQQRVGDPYDATLLALAQARLALAQGDRVGAQLQAQEALALAQQQQIAYPYRLIQRFIEEHHLLQDS